MKTGETNIYNDALGQYSDFIRNGWTSIHDLKKCLRTMEYFEDYEKCKVLSEILRSYEITFSKTSTKKEDGNGEKN